MAKSNAALKVAAPKLFAVADPLEKMLADFAAAIAAYETHNRENYGPRGSFLPTHDRATRAAIEEEGLRLFTAMADLEDALMEWPGNRPLDVYARLLGLWPFMARLSHNDKGEHCGDGAQHEPQEMQAVANSLDAMALILGRPGRKLFAARQG